MLLALTPTALRCCQGAFCSSRAICLLNVCLYVQALVGAESLLVPAQCGACLHDAEFDLHARVKQIWVMTHAQT